MQNEIKVDRFLTSLDRESTEIRSNKKHSNVNSYVGVHAERHAGYYRDPANTER